MKRQITPPKHSDSLRKNKILLGVFVPLGLLVFAGIGIGIGYAIWYHKHNNDGGGDNHDNYFVINDKTTTMVVPKIYRAEKATSSFDDLCCINLESISQQNGSINKFKLEGEINTPIFCPDGYTCDLIGTDNATINLINSPSNKTAGIIFGMTSPNASPDIPTNDINWNISNINIIGNDNAIGVCVLEEISQNMTFQNNKILDCSCGLRFTDTLDVDTNVDIKSNKIVCNRLSTNDISAGILFEDPVYGNVDISQNVIINISLFESFNIVFASNYNGKTEQNYNIYHNTLKCQCHNYDNTKVCKAQSIVFVDMASRGLAIINVYDNVITTHMDNANASSEQFAFSYSCHNSPSTLSAWSNNYYYSNTATTGIDHGCNSNNDEIKALYDAGFEWYFTYN